MNVSSIWLGLEEGYVLCYVLCTDASSLLHQVGLFANPDLKKLLRRIVIKNPKEICLTVCNVMLMLFNRSIAAPADSFLVASSRD